MKAKKKLKKTFKDCWLEANVMDNSGDKLFVIYVMFGNEVVEISRGRRKKIAWKNALKVLKIYFYAFNSR